MSVESRLKKIMDTNRAVDRRTDLLILAKELGCSTQGVVAGGTVVEDEIIRRIRAADSARKATRRWLMATILTLIGLALVVFKLILNNWRGAP